MSNLLFRCSAVGALMTEPKKKGEVLSATAKTLIEAMWLERTYGYREPLVNEYMTKGLHMEQDSMALVQSVLGGAFRVKNRERLKNDHVIGTPDIILPDCVEDIKTSWSLRTFHEADLTTMYIAQAQAYMWLTGRTHYRLIYALVPNTDAAVIGQCERAKWQYRGDYENPDYISHCSQIKRNNDLINEIDPEKRVKVFAFDFDPTYIANLQTKIEAAREYYAQINL